MLIHQGWFTALYTQHLLDSQSLEFEICIFPREAIPSQLHVYCSEHTTKVRHPFHGALRYSKLAFSETWLNDSITDEDISHQLYHKPERKDRADGYGGVLSYVNETLQYKKRRDIEPNCIECIWIELTLNLKHILFDLFYRPPRAEHFSSIEDSIHLAMDTGI